MSLLKKVSIIIFLCLLFNIGCISVDKEIFNKKEYVQKRRPEDIKILYDLPEEVHNIIGRIVVRYNPGYSRQYILNTLRNEASESGADGIYIKKTGHFESRWKIDDHGVSRNMKSGGYMIEVFMYRYR
ncbi:MAG: hypothetical protein OEZ13_02485 [Spirochaetia bacterium]|nr:hypothetical protein [Spirochaetia bacterium]